MNTWTYVSLMRNTMRENIFYDPNCSHLHRGNLGALALFLGCFHVVSLYMRSMLLKKIMKNSANVHAFRNMPMVVCLIIILHIYIQPGIMSTCATDPLVQHHVSVTSCLVYSWFLHTQEVLSVKKKNEGKKRENVLTSTVYPSVNITSRFIHFVM